MSRNIRRVISQFRKGSEADQPESNSAELLNFVSQLTKDGARHPEMNVARLLAERGFHAETDDDNMSLSDGGSMSFHMDGQLSSAVSLGNMSRAVTPRAARTDILSAFSCNLVFRSHTNDGEETEQTVDAPAEALGDRIEKWTGTATVLFIDLSGYSRIAAELISRGGAHALSAAVNGYFETILDIVVSRHGGDVLKFAGDALVVAFVSDGDDRRTCLTAVACALELQKRCGMFPVEGTELFFRLHIGVATGTIESEVFDAPSAKTMQKAYHFVSGAPLEELGALVDCAQKGEVCISARVAEACGDLVQSSGEGRPAGIRLATEIDEGYAEAFDVEPDFVPKRDHALEMKLVHPTIVRKLRQGFLPQHIAEMRFLCVLFIGKAVDAITVGDWFAEVRAILEDGRAPVVQIIDDDKGVHVIAAVSLYVAESDPCNVALKAARRLRDRESGCVVGMAAGEVFCGVTGSEAACRWDITGPACVRACRLMQLAQAAGRTEAIDASVYAATTDVSQLGARATASVKGSLEPVTYYALSAESVTTTSGIFSSLFLTSAIHREARERLQRDVIAAGKQRAIGCVSGPVAVGKKCLVLSLFEMTPFVTMVHALSRSATPLSVAETLSQWFMYHALDDVRELAGRAHAAYAKGHTTQALNLCLQLVSLTVTHGLHTALIVQHGQFLDTLSASLLHQIARQHTAGGATGRFLVFVTIVPMYGAASGVGAMIHRNHPDVQLVKVKLSAANDNEMRAVFISHMFWHPTQPYVVEVRKKCGGVPGFILPLMTKIRDEAVSRIAKRNRGENVRLLTFAPKLGTVEMTPFGRDEVVKWSWPAIAPELSSRYGELYDVLPPRLQLQLRVLGAISCDDGMAMFRTVATVINKLVSKITPEQCENDFRKLEELLLVHRMNKDFVEFTSPMMREVVSRLLTPDQDRLLKRFAARATADILDNEMHTIKCDSNCGAQFSSADMYFYTARLWMGSGDRDKFINNCRRALEEVKKLADPEKGKTVIYSIARVADHYGVDPALISPDIVQKEYVDIVTSSLNLNLQWCKDSFPPFALAGYAGEVQKTCYVLLNEALEIAQPNVRFLDDSMKTLLMINIPSLMEALERFEKVVPLPEEERPFTMPLSEEREFFERITKRDAVTMDDSNKKAVEVRAYYDRVFTSRHRRILKYVSGLSVCVRPAKNTEFKGSMSTAFYRLCEADVDGTIPATAFHAALMDLATDQWRSPYMHITLQGIRDSCLRLQTATFMDLKAMLFCFLLMGTHISGKLEAARVYNVDEWNLDRASPKTPQSPGKSSFAAASS